jgi:hypothetical protein
LKSVRFVDDEPQWTLPEGWSETKSNGGIRFATLTVPAGDGVLPMPMCVETPLPTEFSRISSLASAKNSSQRRFSPLDLIVQPAMAGISPEDTASMTAVLASPGVYTITFQDQEADHRWSGDISDDGSVGSLAAIFQCDEFGDINARIDDVSQNELLLSVDAFGGFVQFRLDPVPLELPEICTQVDQ